MAGSQPAQDPVVLVVDDEPVVRQLMERILLDAGYVVHGASSARGALERVLSLGSPPAVVVTDLRMDDIDGAALARMLLAQWPSLPLLFVTGYGPPTQGGRLPGPLLAKPFNPMDFLAAIEKLVPRLPASKQE